MCIRDRPGADLPRQRPPHQREKALVLRDLIAEKDAVRVQQPDVPVLDWNYMGGGEYDVTVMYRPWLRSLERVELNYQIDGGPWKSIGNFGHLRAHCGQRCV